MSYQRVRDQSPPPLPPPVTSGNGRGFPSFPYPTSSSSSFVPAPPQLDYQDRGHRPNQDSLEVPLLSPIHGPNHSGFGVRGFSGRGPSPPHSSSNPSSGQITPSAELLRPPLDGHSDLESVGKLVDSQHGYASLGTESAFAPAITEKASIFALSADPSQWNTETAPNFPEADDDLHNPDPKRDRWVDNVALYSSRGLLNVGCLLLMATGIFTLFAGFPIIAHFTHTRMGTNGGYNLGGINDTGQIPEMPGNF
ncbi:hypothetical protein FRB90_003722, partial [Tulasnella sp. 427]